MATFYLLHIGCPQRKNICFRHTEAINILEGKTRFHTMPDTYFSIIERTLSYFVLFSSSDISPIYASHFTRYESNLWLKFRHADLPLSLFISYIPQFTPNSKFRQYKNFQQYSRIYAYTHVSLQASGKDPVLSLHIKHFRFL